MKIIVLGGKGFLGRRVVAALEERSYTVAVGGRSGPVVVDVTREETFGGLDDFDVVINCSDTVIASPHQAVEYTLERGKTWIETTADGATLARLADDYRPLAGDSRSTDGVLVMGMGIFPGLSNVLAKHLSEKVESCRHLELAVRFSPFTGAGPGMCRLISHFLGISPQFVVEGRLREVSPFDPGPDLSFPSGLHSTLAVPFVEPMLLQRSLGLSEISAYLSLQPGWLHELTSAMIWSCPSAILRWSLIRDTAYYYLRFLRGVVLRKRPAHIEMTGVAHSSTGESATGGFEFPDAIRATGAAVAAGVNLLPRDLSGGGYFPDEVFDLQELLSEMRDTVVWAGKERGDGK